MTNRFWLLPILAALLHAMPAQAEPTSEDAALAEELFSRGKELLRDGDTERACTMLAESQKLDPAGGTLLALALCHEAQGKTASAWAEFEEALTLAIRQGEEGRAAVARERIAAIQPLVPKLTIVITSAAASIRGLEVQRDRAPVPKAAWNVAMPIDPGERQITVSAPGRVSRTQTILIEPGRTDHRVEIAELDSDGTAPSPPATSGDKPAPRGSATRAAPREAPMGWYAASGAAAGFSAIVFGAAIGSAIRAGDLQESADAVCPETQCSDRKALEDAEEAGRWADAATGLVVVGGLGAAFATVAAFMPMVGDGSDPKKPAPRVELRPGPGTVGLIVRF